MLLWIYRSSYHIYILLLKFKERDWQTLGFISPILTQTGFERALPLCTRLTHGDTIWKGPRNGLGSEGHHLSHLLHLRIHSRQYVFFTLWGPDYGTAMFANVYGSLLQKEGEAWQAFWNSAISSNTPHKTFFIVPNTQCSQGTLHPHMEVPSTIATMLIAFDRICFLSSSQVSPLWDSFRMHMKTQAVDLRPHFQRGIQESYTCGRRMELCGIT